MMIDLKTGQIEIPDYKFVLASDITMNKLKDNLLLNSLLLKVDDMNNGYFWIRTKTINYDDTPLKFSICFNKQQLEFIQFFIEGQYNNRFNWDNWSKEKEFEIKESHDIFLHSILGRIPDEEIIIPVYRAIYKFTWGDVYSLYDDKAASSYIMIKYKI